MEKNEKKTIDLTKVTFKPSLAGKEVTENLQKIVADAIYQNAANLAQDTFARTMYNTEGPIEATEEEIGYIKNAITGYKYFVQEAILKAIE